MARSSRTRSGAYSQFLSPAHGTSPANWRASSASANASASWRRSACARGRQVGAKAVAAVNCAAVLAGCVACCLRASRGTGDVRALSCKFAILLAITTKSGSAERERSSAARNEAPGAHALSGTKLQDRPTKSPLLETGSLALSVATCRSAPQTSNPARRSASPSEAPPAAFAAHTRRPSYDPAYGEEAVD